MANRVFDIPDIGHVTIQKRRSSRKLRLRINQKQQVIVSQPLWLPYKAGLDFARSQKSWIERHRKIPKQFQHLQAIGKLHTLYFLPEQSESVRVSVTSRDIRVRYPQHMSINEPKVQAAAKRGSRKALIHEELLLENRLAELAELHGVHYTSFSCKFMTSKWGSRKSDGSIMLNYRLLDLQNDLIDYVIIHELAHVTFMNHSSAYWQHVEQMLPDYKNRRRALKHVELQWNH